MNPTQDPRQELLAQLNDVISPNAVSWWPLAWGWWVLIVITLIALTVLTLKVVRIYKKSLYRKLAMETLINIETRHTENPAIIASETLLLLKRVYLYVSPERRHNVSGIHGKQWLEHLNTLLKKPESLPETEVINAVLYKACDKDDPKVRDCTTKIVSFARTWIKQHRVKAIKTSVIKTSVIKTSVIKTSAIEKHAIDSSSVDKKEVDKKGVEVIKSQSGGAVKHA